MNKCTERVYNGLIKENPASARRRRFFNGPLVTITAARGIAH